MFSIESMVVRYSSSRPGRSSRLQNREFSRVCTCAQQTSCSVCSQQRHLKPQMASCATQPDCKAWHASMAPSTPLSDGVLLPHACCRCTATTCMLQMLSNTHLSPRRQLQLTLSTPAPHSQLCRAHCDQALCTKQPLHAVKQANRTTVPAAAHPVHPSPTPPALSGSL
jgi:hypothetical protein